MSSIVEDLTFVYISFAKIFCQNSVKKNCKQSFGFLCKNAVVGHMKRRVNDAPDAR